MSKYWIVPQPASITTFRVDGGIKGAIPQWHKDELCSELSAIGYRPEMWNLVIIDYGTWEEWVTEVTAFLDWKSEYVRAHVDPSLVE